MKSPKAKAAAAKTTGEALPEAVEATTAERETKPSGLRSKKLTPTSKINGQTLAEFRNTLPDYRRNEGYQFAELWFDMVKAAWLSQDKEPEVFDLDHVNTWAKQYGLGKPRGEENFALFCHVNEKDLLANYDKFDLERPVYIGKVETGRGKNKATSVILLDGFHRLRKAFLEQQPLKVILLDTDITKLIQNR